MGLFNRLKVGSKLLLLAGVPVLGILALSVLVVRDVQERAHAAAGLGSIEDLAQLTDKILTVLGELQLERAEVAYRAAANQPASPEVQERHRGTDQALRQLSGFLAQRNEQDLPLKLRQALKTAHQQLESLPELRQQPAREDFDLLEYLEYFARANDSLIAATAALTQLSDDKELLLNIGGLVSAMQVIERNAREQALLNYVFRTQEFPPGTFRYMVTLLTEQEVYTDSLRTWASEEDFARLRVALEGPRAAEIQAMRQIAVETTESTLEVDASTWFEAQSENMAALSRMEREMVGTIRSVVSAKMASMRHAVRLAGGLVLVVVVVALLLGWAITRSLTRSVRGLVRVAEVVHENHDFTLRAEKTSSDELGLLTDAFNGMLAGIQERDRELESHRQNLEDLVEARTRQLSERNAEMKLVLDNIDQGLAMLDREGNLIGESSRAFKAAFGNPEPGTRFYEVLAPHDEKVSFGFEAGYEQVMADVLPVELALEQLPQRVVRDGRHYAVSFTPVLHGGQLAGALLVTRDITLELLARRGEAEQRERVQVFERIMRDRVGFEEFVREAERLMASACIDAEGIGKAQPGSEAEPRNEAEQMRALHTLKGVTAVFDVTSVSEAAHELEQALLDREPSFASAARARLLDNWRAFLALVQPVLGEEGPRVDMSRNELLELIEDVRSRTPHSLLLESLRRFTREPVLYRFRRMGDQLARVARRLERPVPRVTLEDNGVRLPATMFREFWSSLAHVVRNIVDYGLEPELERESQGKPSENNVLLCARSDANCFVIEVSDDGRGIDWEQLARKAREKGLPAETEAELCEAIFADGVSTARAVSQTSGRGVGMSVVRTACAALGGAITVESTHGKGTLFRFVFPPLPAGELEMRAEPDSGQQRTA